MKDRGRRSLHEETYSQKTEGRYSSVSHPRFISWVPGSRSSGRGGVKLGNFLASAAAVLSAGSALHQLHAGERSREQNKEDCQGTLHVLVLSLFVDDGSSN